MVHTPRSTLLTITAIVLALLGAALAAGGAWLIALGGSWYYLVGGVGFLVTAGLLLKARPAALWVYAAVVAGTLAWALWESGLDWWALAVRGDVVVPIGLFLLTPWITRAIDRTLVPSGEPRPRRVTALRGGGLALTATLAASLVVAVISWFGDPHRVDGTAPDARAEVPGDARGVPPGEWHAYGRTWDGQRWSPLDQITPENVDRLEVAWTYRTGDFRGQPGDPEETTFQVTPLMMDNRLFLCTPHQLVNALDATTGEEVWRYDPEILGDLALQHLTCRGLTHYAGPAAAPTAAADSPAGEAPVGEDAAGAPAQDSPVPDLPVAAADAAETVECGARLFMPTADGRVIALDPDSGAVCSNFGGGTGQIDLWPNMPNVRPGGYYSTSPVVVASDLVIVGGTVLDNVSTNEQSGVIRAFDATSGELVWNWDSGDPDRTEPLPPGETYVPNSPNSWTIMSVDEELGLVYVPLGNQPPDQWGGNRSENVERFSSAVVALDVETGALAWTFQTVHHDLWDYDVPSQPTLVDLTIAGEAVPALVQPTKQGDIYVLDRRTGEPILPVDEVPVPQGAAEGDWTAPTQPVSALSFGPQRLDGSQMWGATLFDQLACRIQFHRLRYEGRYTPPSTEGTLVHPGNFGVFNWGSIAVDPERQIAFVTPTYLAFVSRLIPREDDTTLYVQGEEPPEGSLPALNENFGAPFAVELYPFTSALGLPCHRPPWGYIAAADLTTGAVIWMHRNGTVEDRAPVPLPSGWGCPTSAAR